MVEAPALGAKVRALRRRRGLTQAQLADRLGVSASSLDLVEHGRRPLPALLLIRLAEVLEPDLKELSSDEEARSVADLPPAHHAAPVGRRRRPLPNRRCSTP
jgi:transcriptional regulator with XRE-family HTH domain